MVALVGKAFGVGVGGYCGDWQRLSSMTHGLSVQELYSGSIAALICNKKVRRVAQGHHIRSMLHDLPYRGEGVQDILYPLSKMQPWSLSYLWVLGLPQSHRFKDKPRLVHSAIREILAKGGDR